MSYAPSDLLSCHNYLREKTGKPAVYFGIVGDTSHGGEGYHVGWDRLSQVYGRGDYSWGESSRDNSYSNAASALDIGEFSTGSVSLRSLSLAIVAACQRGDPRVRDIREIIYTPDGSTVRRWDRLGIRSGGDSSHTYHTHISFFRDSEGRRANDDNFLGLLKEVFDGPRPVAKTNKEAAMLIAHNVSGWVLTDWATWCDDTISWGQIQTLIGKGVVDVEVDAAQMTRILALPKPSELSQANLSISTAQLNELKTALVGAVAGAAQLTPSQAQAACEAALAKAKITIS